MSETTGATVMGWLRSEPWRFDLVVAIATVGCGVALSAGTPDDFDTGWPDAVAGVGAFVVLALRSRWPWALFGIAVAWATTHVLVFERPTLLVFAALVLLSTVCVRLDRWRAIALGAVCAVGLYGMGLHINDSAEFGDARAVIFIAWVAVAVGVADAVRSFRRARESADAQLRSALLATEAQTRQHVSEERLTIARELHDLLAHNLSVINVHTGAALHLLREDPEQAERSLTTARDAGTSVLDELRELLNVLRHDDSDDALTSSLPTIEQIPELVETMRSAGLDVRLTYSGAPRQLAPAVSLAAYRIIQEGLTNAAKHGSGPAELTTDWDADGLRIQVINPLVPSQGEGGGHGLVGMRERAVSNGGRLSARGVDGFFVVDAWLPATIDQEVDQ